MAAKIPKAPPWLDKPAKPPFGIITLLRRVKSVTGRTPIEILVDLRLTKAMELIKAKSADQSIGNIAYEVGFNDPSYFARKFKEHFGILPSQV